MLHCVKGAPSALGAHQDARKQDDGGGCVAMMCLSVGRHDTVPKPWFAHPVKLGWRLGIKAGRSDGSRSLQLACASWAMIRWIYRTSPKGAGRSDFGLERRVE